MMIYKNGDNKNPICTDTEVESLLIEMGTETITLDKMYGPTIFATIRIRPDISCGRVIERQWINSGKWIEWVTIHAQIPEEFCDEE